MMPVILCKLADVTSVSSTCTSSQQYCQAWSKSGLMPRAATQTCSLHELWYKPSLFLKKDVRCAANDVQSAVSNLQPCIWYFSMYFNHTSSLSLLRRFSVNASRVLATQYEAGHTLISATSGHAKAVSPTYQYNIIQEALHCL